MKKNVLSRKIFRVFTLIFAFLIPKMAFPIWPLIGAGIAFPLLGGLTHANIKSKMAFVNELVDTIEFGLFIAVSVLILVFAVYLFKLLHQKLRNRKIRRVVTLLSSIEADVAFLRNEGEVSTDELLKAVESRNKFIVSLVDVLNTRFFVRNIHGRMHDRIVGSLHLMKKNAFDLETQGMLVDQWIRKFAFVGV